MNSTSMSLTAQAESETAIKARVVAALARDWKMVMKSTTLTASLIIPGFMFLGGQSSAANDTWLSEQGITHVLNCCDTSVADKSLYPRHKIESAHYPILDDPSENLVSIILPCVLFLRRAKKEKGRVLVHCALGVSRSASIVAAFLMDDAGLSLLEAMELMRRCRPIICPNEGFLCQLWTMERLVRGSNSIPIEVLQTYCCDIMTFAGGMRFYKPVREITTLAVARFKHCTRLQLNMCICILLEPRVSYEFAMLVCEYLEFEVPEGKWWQTLTRACEIE